MERCGAEEKARIEYVMVNGSFVLKNGKRSAMFFQGRRCMGSLRNEMFLRINDNKKEK